MRYQRARARRGGFVNRVLHHGREFGRHVDAFVRQFGPALKVGAMSLAPALASAGLPQAAAATADADVEVTGCRSREQRDAAGFRNAQVLQGGDDDDGDDEERRPGGDGGAAQKRSRKK